MDPFKLLTITSSPRLLLSVFREDNYVVGDMAFTVIVSLYVILVGIAGETLIVL